MSLYVREPIEFKQYPTVVNIVNVVEKEPVKSAVKPVSIPPGIKEAISNIDFVLFSNNGLNPAQREALKKAKELLNVT